MKNQLNIAEEDDLKDESAQSSSQQTMPTEGTKSLQLLGCQHMVTADDQPHISFLEGKSSSDDPYAILHTVRGKPRHGLIVDPGAAEGLLGTETILKWNLNLDQPEGIPCDLRASQATFTGINGQADPSCGEFRGPVCVEGMQSGTTYQADLIGGSGARCPGLLPNSTM
eukprot:6515667-Pyramimonas_sp.AAC.1